MTRPFPILLLDDEPAVADLLKHALGQQFPQAHLDYAASLDAAINYLDDANKRCRLSLVLLDIDLKDSQSGLELIARLHGYSSCNLAPIVVLSDHERPDWIKEAYDKGISAYTVKPISFADWNEYARLLRMYWSDAVTIPSQVKQLHCPDRRSRK